MDNQFMFETTWDKCQPIYMRRVWRSSSCFSFRREAACLCIIPNLVASMREAVLEAQATRISMSGPGTGTTITTYWIDQAIRAKIQFRNNCTITTNWIEQSRDSSEDSDYKTWENSSPCSATFVWGCHSRSVHSPTIYRVNDNVDLFEKLPESSA